MYRLGQTLASPCQPGKQNLLLSLDLLALLYRHLLNGGVDFLVEGS